LNTILVKTKPILEPKQLGALKRLASTNTFIRGFCGAFAAMSITADVFSLENYEVARSIVHAVAAWNELASAIGVFVGALPFLPSLSVAAVNSIIFLLSVSFPAIFGLYEMFRPIREKASREEWFVRWILPIGSILTFSYIAIAGALLFKGGSTEFLTEWVPAGAEPGSLTHKSAIPVYVGWYGAGIVLPFIIAQFLKPYRQATLILFGFLVCVQLFYSAPSLLAAVSN